MGKTRPRIRCVNALPLVLILLILAATTASGTTPPAGHFAGSVTVRDTAYGIAVDLPAGYRLTHGEDEFGHPVEWLLIEDGHRSVAEIHMEGPADIRAVVQLLQPGHLQSYADTLRIYLLWEGPRRITDDAMYPLTADSVLSFRRTKNIHGFDAFELLCHTWEGGPDGESSDETPSSPSPSTARIYAVHLPAGGVHRVAWIHMYGDEGEPDHLLAFIANSMRDLGGQ